jgi:hypothetical protein
VAKMNEMTVGIEVSLDEPDSFLKIKETLTRIGVASRKDKKLYQSCHILHKRGKYYICHFKELFILDGKPSTLSEDDLLRRNLITSLLNDWGLLGVINISDIEQKAAMNTVKVLAFSDKNQWSCVSKYSIGSNKHK